MEHSADATRLNDLIDQLSAAERALLIARLVQPLIADESYRAHFTQWEERGFHITPNDFYQPIPDTRMLSQALWRRAHPLPGVNMNDDEQLRLVRDVFSGFTAECALIPDDKTDDPVQYYFRNGWFEHLDGSVAYSMVRHFKPSRILELGSGMSTLVIAQAVARNGNQPDYTVIDPYPNAIICSGVPQVSRLTIQMAEYIPLDLFASLGAGDVLFIDTSHVVKIGGEVNYLLLEALPILKPGVVVHIHDIFLPFEYPEAWVRERKQFWTEQYLLQAFLCFNEAFEVLLGASYVASRYPDALARTFPRTQGAAPGGSFWIRRTGATVP